jgi:hypothetical protein
MSPDEQRELEEAVTEASRALQRIQELVGRSALKDAEVRFPRGYLRTAGEHRDRFPFVEDKDLRANLAYTMILADTIYWLLIRTDLSGTAREMLIKLFLFLFGTMTESITKEYLRGICGKGFKDRNEYLLKAGIIDESLTRDLDWMWDVRNNMHLWQLEEREYINDYNTESQDRCTKAFRELLAALTKKGRFRS